MVMRITGMSSGMDIDSMIRDLMSVERLPLQKLQRKQKLISYESDLYREINTKVAALRTKLDGVRYSSTMTGMKAASSSTDVSVASNSVTSAKSLTLNVSQLAVAAEVKGAAGVTNLGLSGTVIGGPVTVTEGVNDKILIQLDTSTKTVTVPDGTYNNATELAAALQTAVNDVFGANKLTVTDVGGALNFKPVPKSGFEPQVIVKESTLDFSEIGLANGQSYRLNLNAKISELSGKLATSLDGSASYGFTVNGAMITVDPTTDTLNTVMAKVNQSGAGVTMSYDSTTDQFVFKNRNTGAASEVNLASVNGNFLAAVGVADGVTAGQDAQFTVDGVAKTMSSNKFTLDGINYTLNKANSTDITITLSNDPDAIVGKLKDFVTAYNDMIDLVNKRLTETRSRGYDPLLDDEKGELSESDAALWEAETKKGLLRNSDLLREFRSKTRELFSKQIDGVDTYNVLSSIGITTLPYVQGNPQDSGKLQINEEKLKEAIAANPEAVNQLLTNNTGVESREGIMVSMYNRVSDMITDLNAKAGRTTSAAIDVTNELGRRMYDLQQKVNTLESKLSKKEDYYYSRFSTMETAISKSNSTISWLMSQMG